MDSIVAEEATAGLFALNVKNPAPTLRAALFLPDILRLLFLRNMAGCLLRLSRRRPVPLGTLEGMK
jgi:hypothetical protein